MKLYNYKKQPNQLWFKTLAVCTLFFFCLASTSQAAVNTPKKHPVTTLKQSQNGLPEKVTLEESSHRIDLSKAKTKKQTSLKATAHQNVKKEFVLEWL